MPGIRWIPLQIKLFSLGHVGKSGNVLGLALNLDQIVASSGSRSVCMVERRVVAKPALLGATAALLHFPKEKS